MKITICLIFGLPAVGKTTLSRALIKYIHGHTSHHCCLFTYDELMPEKIVFEEEEENGSNVWKVHRSEVFEHIENTVSTLRDTENKNVLNITPNGKLCQCFQDCKSTAVQHILLIDDNLFYKSMRYVFYQLARKYECSFCQVYVTDSLDTLFERNDTREGVVTTETISKMHQLFEVPDPPQNVWEKNTLTFLSNTLTGECGSVQKILLYIENCFDDIVQPLLSEHELKERMRNRQKTLENYCHQCDQLLRKHISKQMIAAKSNGLQKHELRSMGIKLNGLRKNYLDRLRTIDNEEFLLVEFNEEWRVVEIEKFQHFSIAAT